MDGGGYRVRMTAKRTLFLIAALVFPILFIVAVIFLLPGIVMWAAGQD